LVVVEQKSYFQRRAEDLRRLHFELGTGPSLFIAFVFVFFLAFLLIPIGIILYWSITQTGNPLGVLGGDYPGEYLFKPFLDIFLDNGIWGGGFTQRLDEAAQNPLYSYKPFLAAILLIIILILFILTVSYYSFFKKRFFPIKTPLSTFTGIGLIVLTVGLFLAFIGIFWGELKMMFAEPIITHPTDQSQWGTKWIIQGPDLGGLPNSVLVALSTTILSATFGIFFAFIMARFTFVAKDLFRPLLLLPLIIPPFVSIIGFQSILGENGAVNELLFQAFNTKIVMGGSVGIIFVQFLHFYTLVYLNVYSSLVNIDPSLEECAENLGAKGPKLIRSITLPLAMPGIAAGSVLAFILAIEDIGTPLIFKEIQTGDVFNYMPTMIFSNLINFNAYSARGYDVIGKYAALAAILVIIAIVGFLLIRRFVSLKHYAMISKGRVGEARTSPASVKLSIILVILFTVFIPIALIPHLGTILFAIEGEGFFYFTVLLLWVGVIGFAFYYFIREQEGTRRILGWIGALAGFIGFIGTCVVAYLEYVLPPVESTEFTGFIRFLSYLNIGHPADASAVTLRDEFFLTIWNMFLYSLIATLIIVVLATITSYFIARKDFPGKNMLDTIVTLPLAIPGIIIGFGYFIMFFGETTPIISLFNPENNPILLLIVSYTVRKFTFTMRAAFAGMQQVDVQLEEASLNLGAGRSYTIWKVTVPMIAMSVFAGGMISLVYCMSEVSTTIILLESTFNPGQFGTATWKIWQISRDPNVGLGLPMAAVLGIVLMVIQSISIVITNVLLKSRSEAITGI
jgi:ABC-type Fe3+ transport system permease subunit